MTAGRRLQDDWLTIMLARFDNTGNPIDISKNGYHSVLNPSGIVLTNYNTTIVSVANKPFTHARQFLRASSQYITIDNHSVFNTVDFTFEAWIYLYDLSDDAIIFDTTNGGGGAKLYVDTSGNLKFDVIAQDEILAAGIEIETWYHIMGSYNRRQSTICINGAIVKNYYWASHADHSRTGGTIYIGRNVAGSNYFNGMICEVRFSNKARGVWDANNVILASQDPQIGLPVDANTLWCWNGNQVLESTNNLYDDVNYPNGKNGTLVRNDVSHNLLLPGPISGIKRRYHYSRIEIPIVTGSPIFDLSNDWSIEFWYQIKLSPDSNSGRCIGRHNPGVAQYLGSFSFYRNSVNDNWYWYFNDNVVSAWSGVYSLTENQLCYAVATLDSSTKTFTFYNNGRINNIATEPTMDLSSFNSHNGVFALGDYYTGQTSPDDGYHHAIRISNIIRTQEEIQANYNGKRLLERI